MCFAMAVLDVSTTALRITMGVFIRRCVCEGHVAKAVCFAIAAFDLTTAPRMKMGMLTLRCVSEGRVSKSMFCDSGVRRVHCSSAYKI